MSKLPAALLHLSVALMFILSAVLQFNDPDPIFWSSIYLCVAGVPMTRLLGWRSPAIIWLPAGMVIAGLLLSLNGFLDYLLSADYSSIFASMQAERPYIESAREFLGLVICGVCLFVYGKLDGK